jgi:hypothetical protein
MMSRLRARNNWLLLPPGLAPTIKEEEEEEEEETMLGALRVQWRNNRLGVMPIAVHIDTVCKNTVI